LKINTLKINTLKINTLKINRKVSLVYVPKNRPNAL
jgi:hypothetical protein